MKSDEFVPRYYTYYEWQIAVSLVKPGVTGFLEFGKAKIIFTAPDGRQLKSSDNMVIIPELPP